MHADGLRLALTGQSLIKRDLRAIRHPQVRALRTLLRDCDAAFTNFEGTLRTEGAWATKEGFTHDAPPEALDTLVDFGFNLVSLSNNHAFDLGPPGVLATLAAAGARGLVVAGSGESLSQAGAPAMLETTAGRVALVAMDASGLPDFAYARDASPLLPARPGINPLRIRRGVALPESLCRELRDVSEALGHERRKRERLRKGYPQGVAEDAFEFYGTWIHSADAAAEHFVPAPADLERNLQTIARARDSADVVVAYLHQHHWAPRWQDTPAWLEQFGKACIDAGASVFVGHGVPMPLGMGFHCGCPLFYGLGNFIFHSARLERYPEAEVWASVVAECHFGAHGVTVELHPITLDVEGRDCPRLAATGSVGEMLASLGAHSRMLGARLEVRDDGRVWLLPHPAAAG